MLITSDGGRTWRQKTLFDEPRFGSIAQFWFESKATGELAIDHASKHELYRTNTGGESWELEQVSAQPLKLKAPREELSWRLRADGTTYHLERRGSSNWQSVAAFPIHIADCK
jgi:photosystem II stability/assembly factor-like uncharacterized protein